MQQRRTNEPTPRSTVTSFPLARQNGRTIDRASTDECVSPSQTSANNVRKQCPGRQNGRLERIGRLRTVHRRFRRHTVSETGGFPPHTDGQGCEGLFSHLPTSFVSTPRQHFSRLHTPSPSSVPWLGRPALSLRARLPTAHPFHETATAAASCAQTPAVRRTADRSHGKDVRRCRRPSRQPFVGRSVPRRDFCRRGVHGPWPRTLGRVFRSSDRKYVFCLKRSREALCCRPSGQALRAGIDFFRFPYTQLTFCVCTLAFFSNASVRVMCRRACIYTVKDL